MIKRYIGKQWNSCMYGPVPGSGCVTSGDIRTEGK